MPTIYKFSLPGKIASPSKYSAQSGMNIPGVTIKTYEMSSLRSDTAKEQFEAQADDVFEIVTEDDVVIYQRVDQYISKVKRTARSRSQTFDETAVIEIPFEMESHQRSRKNIAKAVVKFISVIKDWVVDKVTLAIARAIEPSNNSLHLLLPDFKLSNAPTSWQKRTPYLLFIHGTASSTEGSFRGIMDHNASIWSRLVSLYNGNVLCFEHRTLTESPIKNAIDLISQLPNDIQLDLVTHSRGGLIGEVLTRIQYGSFFDKSIQTKNIDKEFDHVLKEIAELEKVIRSKKIKISNFVRVACPAGGTSLLDTKLDLWLNTLLNGFKIIPYIRASAFFNLFCDFVKSVVHERTDIKTLPGLEAMIPDSGFIKFINQRDRNLDETLYTITGDARSSKIYKSLVSVVADAYFEEPNDLVVQTNSSTKGTQRVQVMQHYSREKEVDHFHFFSNPKSCLAIYSALDEKESKSAYVAITELSTATRSIKVAKAFDPKRPTVVIVPGIMGSHLKFNNDRLWLQYLEIIKGKLKGLDINQTITPDGIVDRYYGKLESYFYSKNYNVISFDYDWRLNILDEAKRFNQMIADLVLQNQNIQFICHSMGGLVFLSAYNFTKSAINNLFSQNANARVLFLGVPVTGSYSILSLLTGRDRIIKTIALIDIYNSKKTLLQVFSKFPGMIQLMPFHDQRMKDKQFFNTIAATIPSDQALSKYDDLKQHLSHISWNKNQMSYIAGKDRTTIENVAMEGELIFHVTDRGDGRVLWDHIPSDLKESTYYIPVSHGELANESEYFDDFKEILENGSSRKLSKTPPLTTSRSAVITLDEIQEDEAILEYPSVEDVDSILGKKKVIEYTEIEDNVQICLTHGNLVYAENPVVVGHFKNDSILQAEKVLDNQLHYKLSAYHEIGNYAEEVGESIVILNPETNLFKGGIVIGLGNFGTLFEGSLKESVHYALIQYCFKLNEAELKLKQSELCATKISFVLIGTGFGGISIHSCVKAIMTAIKEVNTKVIKLQTTALPLIREVEFIELYRHKVIQAGRILMKLVEDPQFSNFMYDGEIRKVSGAKSYIPDEVNTDWWHRIKIAEQVLDDCMKEKSSVRPLVFTAITDKSRAEEKTLPTNILIVEALLEATAKEKNFNRELSKALFQLLIPNEFKQYASDQRNLVLIVDRETARYPWELICDSTSDQTKPVVYASGLVRQMSTNVYRAQIEYSKQDNALVIGNPKTHGAYLDLQGAKKEAELVVSILEENRFKVDALIEKEFEEIILPFISNSYKIIHIAAHGIHKHPETNQSGIIIGKKAILTPDIIKQMDNVPQFVFVNCCELGKIDPKMEALLQSKYEVAASIGCELIALGVKAVIVAGWEVDDAAAAHFSEVFYKRFMAGENFGDSVKSARITTYNEYPSTNTWGAYQCYGDPFFSMVNINPYKSSKIIILDAEEAVTVLQNKLGEIQSSKLKTKAEFKEDIDKVVRSIPPKFLKHSVVLQKLAELHRAVGSDRESADYYERAFLCEDSEYSLGSIEQYYQLSVQNIKEILKNNSKTKQLSKSAIAAYKKDALDFVEKLEKLDMGQQSIERATLIAGAYKRLFMIHPIKGYLMKMCAQYEKAYLQQCEATEKINYYPYFNFTLLQLLLHNKIDADFPQRMEQALAYAKEEQRHLHPFWGRAAKSFSYQIELIHASSKAEIQSSKKKLISDFQDAWRISGTELEKSSHLNHLDFLVCALEKTTQNKPPKTHKLDLEKLVALREVIGEIEGMEVDG